VARHANSKQADGRIFAVLPTPAQEDDSQQLLLTEQGLKDVPTGYYLIRWPIVADDQWHYEFEKGEPSKKFRVSFKVLFARTNCDVRKRHFTDCLAVEQIDEETDLRVVTTYARNVGPVKYVYYKLRDAGEGKPVQSVELVSYSLRSADQRKR